MTDAETIRSLEAANAALRAERDALRVEVGRLRKLLCDMGENLLFQFEEGGGWDWRMCGAWEDNIKAALAAPPPAPPSPAHGVTPPTFIATPLCSSCFAEVGRRDIGERHLERPDKPKRKCARCGVMTMGLALECACDVCDPPGHDSAAPTEMLREAVDLLREEMEAHGMCLFCGPVDDPMSSRHGHRHNRMRALLSRYDATHPPTATDNPNPTEKP